ncbi:Chromosome segregation ATPase [Myxococcus hansupus]|uniref:Chromosome segregation ATPase n=1 Tax=Pseudomyxococcus hansupus TaxID=1297742 RepID=A0A0H4X7G0_9BACT|nr:Chromosome segregation ATPase [Myxococcus hansupus]
MSLLMSGLFLFTAVRLASVRKRFKPVLDVEAERQRVTAELERAKAESAHALAAERNRVAAELTRAREDADTAIRKAQAELLRVKEENERAISQERTRTQGELTRLREQAETAAREAEVRRQQAQVERSQLENAISRLSAELRPLEEEAVLRSYGLYKPIYNFSTSQKYEERLDDLREQQKTLLKDKKAAYCTAEWEVNGSKAEGRKQTERTLKLMLRAFNGEADACVAKVTYKNVKAMEARIQKAADAITELAKIQQCFIDARYVNLKLDELHLAHEYEEKRQQEKDEQRRIREQMREEETAQRELERARLEAEREARRDEEALRKARAEFEQSTGTQQQKLQERIAELERRLAEDLERQRAISQAQLTRTGHVYVISNIGSFGEDIFKLGMTRRLVPQDRIDELGDASVPFEFDVHAIIRTVDAPKLEAELHRTFAHRRVNRINERKEFFRASLDEIADAVRKHHGDFELTRVAEAAEYRKSLALTDEEQRTKEGTARRPAA